MARIRTAVRPRLVLAFACVAALTAAPTSAQGAVTVGSVMPQPSLSCNPGESNAVQAAVGAGSPSYTVPSAGIVTSWSHYGRIISPAGSGKLLFWTPTGSPTQWTVVAKSDSQNFTDTVLNTFSASIPVQAGWVLGLRSDVGPVGCGIPGVFEDVMLLESPGTEPTIGAPRTFGSEFTNTRLNVSAVVEADADGDGLGDDSQDPCPGSAANDCPPPKPPNGGSGTCRGQAATIFGTKGKDAITGSPGNDVIAAGDGNDRISGGGGTDRICGEGGNDRLAGGPGKRDFCNGGQGKKDVAARSCEKVKSAK